jgi:hypothetical protein
MSCPVLLQCVLFGRHITWWGPWRSPVAPASLLQDQYVAFAGSQCLLVGEGARLRGGEIGDVLSPWMCRARVVIFCMKLTSNSSSRSTDRPASRPKRDTTKGRHRLPYSGPRDSYLPIDQQPLTPGSLELFWDAMKKDKTQINHERNSSK